MCVDTGSTFTKAAAVVSEGPDAGALLATASVATTVGAGQDVLTGLDAAVAEVVAVAGGEPTELRVCSSAGGGLRLAVVGYERLVTAEAGHRVALSAGAKVVHVAAGRLDAAGISALRADRPDVVLLVGGTDGGDQDVLRHNGSRLATSGPRVPYVVAGNAEARDEVLGMLQARGRTVVGAANVLPRIGVLDPEPARAAIREVFVRHVIGGKGISKGKRFARLVRGATPDLVLTGVEVLADGIGGDVLLVDVGGATTDVYSALDPDPADVVHQREVVEATRCSRTVEGDLGMRWSAMGVVDAAVTEKLVDGERSARLRVAAELRHADVAYLPDSDVERAVDADLAALAATVAVRRHARAVGTGEVRTAGRDLSRVRLVLASGGVFRHAAPERLDRMFAAVLDDRAGGWKLPVAPVRDVDRSYVLAAVGLLAPEHTEAATALARTALATGSRRRTGSR